MRLRRTVAVAGVALAALGVMGGLTFARQLGAREARDALARLLGGRPDGFRVKSVSPGLMSDDATVTAQMDVTFQLHKGKDGAWEVSSVRLADGRWEDVQAIRRALDTEKAERARADIRSLATGAEAYRRERGFYPEAETGAALVDKITPRYLPDVVREDPWHQPYFYTGTASAFRVFSAGPDGKADTPDDIVVMSGREGASR
jgi:hypothetical protein